MKAGPTLALLVPAVFALFAQAPRPLTFSRDIAPLIEQNCAVCHRPGEAAPFSLLTYEDVRKHARQIVAVTKSRYMPPWLPQPGYGDFDGERRLTDTQIKLIADWVSGGSVEGGPAPPPPPLHLQMAGNSVLPI